eukprot:TRINITY_DN102268_c0_g1_i1.p1 TRINITY_DN102268_c0_g1~~TRINITY_DN102268_c0_g1_i1.p1  ORF type:complete len:873 (+),score=383.49 TRINITY_DN102268_c0_g1_i1:80-2698(+)
MIRSSLLALWCLSVVERCVAGRVDDDLLQSDSDMSGMFAQAGLPQAAPAVVQDPNLQMMRAADAAILRSAQDAAVVAQQAPVPALSEQSMGAWQIPPSASTVTASVASSPPTPAPTMLVATAASPTGVTAVSGEVAANAASAAAAGSGAPCAAACATGAATAAAQGEAKELQTKAVETEQEKVEGEQKTKQLKEAAETADKESKVAEKEAEDAETEEKQVNSTVKKDIASSNVTSQKKLKDFEAQAEAANKTVAALTALVKNATEETNTTKKAVEEANLKAAAAAAVVHGRSEKEKKALLEEPGAASSPEPGPEELKLRAEQAQVRQEAVAEAATATLAYARAQEKEDFLKKRLQQAEEASATWSLRLKDAQRDAQNGQLDFKASSEKKARAAAAKTSQSKEKATVAKAAAKKAKEAVEKNEKEVKEEEKKKQEEEKKVEKAAKDKAKKSSADKEEAEKPVNRTKVEADAKKKLAEMEKKRGSEREADITKEVKDTATSVNKSATKVVAAKKKVLEEEAAVKKAQAAEQVAKEKLGQAEEEEKKDKLKQAEVAQEAEQFASDQQMSVLHQSKKLEAEIEKVKKVEAAAKTREQEEEKKKEKKTEDEDLGGASYNATKEKLAKLMNESVKMNSALKNQTAAVHAAQEAAEKITAAATKGLNDVFVKGHGSLPAASAPIVQDTQKAAAKTSLAKPAKAGDTSLDVESTSGFTVGDTIMIGSEQNKVRGFGSILLEKALEQNHPLGTVISVVKDIVPSSQMPTGDTVITPAATQPAYHGMGWTLKGRKDGVFTVSVDKTPGSQLGFLSRVDSDAIVVEGVKDTGLLSEWNKDNPTEQVKVGDKIVEINGVRGSGEQMSLEVPKTGPFKIVVMSGS